MRIYRHIVIESSLPPATTGEINAIEKVFSMPLPGDFKDFLVVANGGIHDYVVDVDLGGQLDSLSFGGLFATRPSASGSQERTFLHALGVIRALPLNLSDGLLPVAVDGGGSVLFIDLSEKDHGQICAFIHRMPSWTGHPESDALVIIARSFSDYVSKLYIPEDDARAMIQRAKGNHDLQTLKYIREYLDVGMPDWRNRLGTDAIDL